MAAKKANSTDGKEKTYRKTADATVLWRTEQGRGWAAHFCSHLTMITGSYGMKFFVSKWGQGLEWSPVEALSCEVVMAKVSAAPLSSPSVLRMYDSACRAVCWASWSLFNFCYCLQTTNRSHVNYQSLNGIYMKWFGFKPNFLICYVI